MPKDYNPFDWYWLDAEQGQVYSSRRQRVVLLTDQDYRDFIEDGTKPTRHPGDEELAAVLAAYGLQLYPPDPLVTAKAAKRDAAIALLATKQAAGIAYGGKMLQLREEDLPRIEGFVLKALVALNPSSGVTWPEGFAWRMADNSLLALATPAEMIQMGDEAAIAYAALRAQLGAIKDAVEAAETVEAVAAIDETAGWP